MVVTGHEVFLCRTMTAPEVGAVVAAAMVEAEAEVVGMVTANVAVGILPPPVPFGLLTVVVPECQRMGMVKAEANNTIHRKQPFTKNDTPASIEPNRRAQRLGQISNPNLTHKTSILVYEFTLVRFECLLANKFTMTHTRHTI